MRLAIATCCPLPEPDPDQEALTEALSARGAVSELVAWDDAETDWSSYDACVLRSTWDYHRRPEAFMAWVERVGRATRLLNPSGVVRWNSHKAYLLELGGAGVPVTPTVLLRRGSPIGLREVLDVQRWERAVVKPAVSAGSHATIRVDRDDLEVGQAHLAQLLQREDALVQAYLPSVEGHGERALVWIAGRLTHAVRKSPRLAGDDESVSTVPIEPDERALAQSILAPFTGQLLYARVDLARDPNGAPCLMELELIEPSLFLADEPQALAALADALAGLS